MAATDCTLPKWLVESKHSTSKCKEWSDFVDVLYDVIEQQLKESHVTSLGELTDAERILFLDRAASAIQTGDTYSRLHSRMSILLDQHLNNNVAKQLMDERPIATKTDVILDTTLDAIKCLLNKWPDMKDKLKVCFNQPMLPSLRQTTWSLFLRDDKVRKHYIDLLLSNPTSAMSSMDLDISKHCEQLLMNEKTFSHLNGSLGAFYAMKAVLSHYHAVTKMKEELSECDYLLMIPFVQLVSGMLRRDEPASSDIVTLLVEQYVSFMKSRHAALLNAKSNVTDEALKRLAVITSEHLQLLSPDLARFLADMFVPSSEMIVSTNKVSNVILQEAVYKLSVPVISSLFVGYVTLDVVLFIWDQYIIGLQMADFHDAYLPAVMAIFLSLLASRLKACTSPQSLDEALKTYGPQLMTHQFQFKISKYFYKDLQPMLNSPVRAFDPTEGNCEWINWSSEKIPNRITPEDRRQAREEIELERQDKLRIKMELERRLKEEKDNTRQAEERFQREMSQQQRQHATKMLQLQKQLQEEKKHRDNIEKKAAWMTDQLEQTSDELKKFKEKSENMLVQSLESSYQLYSQPVVTTDEPVEGVPQPREFGRISTSLPVEDLMISFLERLTSSYTKLAHGENREKDVLVEETRTNILNHVNDLQAAEFEVFGRHLHQNEYVSLPAEEKESAGSEMMKLMQGWREQRLQAENQ